MGLVIFIILKFKGGLKEEFLDVLVELVDVIIEVVLIRLWKRWVEVGVVGEVVCLKEKGVIMGIVLSGFVLLKIGLKVGVKIFGVEDIVVVIEILEYKEFLILSLGGRLKMGFDMGLVEVVVGDVDVG